MSSLKVIDNSEFDEQNLPLHLFSIDFLQTHSFLPLKVEAKSLLIAILSPVDKNLLAEVQFYCGLNTHYVIYEATLLQQMRDRALAKYQVKTAQQFDATELAKLIQQIQAENSYAHDELHNEQTPVARFVQKILTQAVQQGASDLHFEPYQNYYRIRFRCDGILYIAYEPPLALANRIATRLKIMAHLDIAEQRLPQDGHCKIKLVEHDLDIRISTCPVLNGEKIVLRLLDLRHLQMNLDHLGLTAEQQSLLATALHKTQGMILVTGPTGSGKTMTLYSAIKRMNQTQLNIVSIEDPIEIYLAGINQVAVNLKSGLDFATALRNFLRQDPDIIMVGEIRDSITIEIALKAAQTGHLVLSTLHTNSAVETISRLLHMGVKPYQITSSISLIIAQRLVRKLCQFCKTMTQQKTIIAHLDTHYLANACHHCKDGYSGRTAIYEILPISMAIQEIILRNGTTLEVKQQALEEGFCDLSACSLEKVTAGITSLNEVLRVIHV